MLLGGIVRLSGNIAGLLEIFWFMSTSSFPDLDLYSLQSSLKRFQVDISLCRDSDRIKQGSPNYESIVQLTS